MDMEFWKTKKFSRIQKEWDEILAQSGFVDIEKEVNGQRVLKQNSANSYRTRDPLTIEAKFEFYTLIAKALTHDRNLTARDRIIMTRYSDGIKQCEIQKELEKAGMPCHRITIIRTISRFLKKWKIPTSKPRKTI